jgi:hypothetical protein
MKKMLLLAMAMFLVRPFFGSVTLAEPLGQGTTMNYGTAMLDRTTMIQVLGGGPAILLPVAALMLGSGVLMYAILRRRT